MHHSFPHVTFSLFLSLSLPLSHSHTHIIFPHLSFFLSLSSCPHPNNPYILPNQEIEKSSANHFLILFRDAQCQFRAVYTANSGSNNASGGNNASGNNNAAGGGGGESSEELVRLCGMGPRVISCADIEAIYKYSSDRKQFSAIPSKTMSMSVDAFTIPAHLWHTKKQSTPKKAATPK